MISRALNFLQFSESSELVSRRVFPYGGGLGRLEGGLIGGLLGAIADGLVNFASMGP